MYDLFRKPLTSFLFEARREKKPNFKVMDWFEIGLNRNSSGILSQCLSVVYLLSCELV